MVVEWVLAITLVYTPGENAFSKKVIGVPQIVEIRETWPSLKNCVDVYVAHISRAEFDAGHKGIVQIGEPCQPLGPPAPAASAASAAVKKPKK